jgi:hypothetical protein
MASLAEFCFARPCLYFWMQQPSSDLLMMLLESE